MSQQMRHRGTRDPPVRGHLRDDLGDVDRGAIVAPAIVIGHHPDQRVRQFRLAREACLGHRGHADHVAAPVAVEAAFGAGRELRAFHRQIGRALRDASARRGDRRRRERAQPLAGRIGERDVRDQPAAEERRGALHGAVDELVDERERARRQFLTQRPDRGDREQIGAARALQRVDIGAHRNVTGQMDVPAAVARQEADRDIPDASEQDLVAGRAPWRLDAAPFGILQPVDGIEAGAANDPDGPLRVHH